MNNIDLVGNVGQHPALRHTGNGTPVANVSLATNRVYKDGAGNRQQTTEWHRLVIWGEPATTLAKIVGRGDLLAVRGRLEYKQREIAGETVQDASIRILEWTKLSPRKAQPEEAAVAEEAEPPSAPGGDDDGFQLDDDIAF
jgi:single-strand DNA-binding protein